MILENLETIWRDERQKFFWNRVFEKVLLVKDMFLLATESAKIDKKLTATEYNLISGSKDFKDVLVFLWKSYNGEYGGRYACWDPLKSTLEFFKPLDITTHDALVLLKYKEYNELLELGYNKDFFTLDDGIYQECRSIVIDWLNESIVLCPQRKFFNLNENEDISEEVFRRKMNSAIKIEITNKMDGSNQNYRYYNGDIIGAGSEALDIDKSWRLKEGKQLLTLDYQRMIKAYPDYTFMFEYISPKNPIVVNYKEDGLFLFGMRNVYNGLELPFSQVAKIATAYNVKAVENYNESFDDILKQLDNYKAQDKEGWVISLWDSGGRVLKAKLKINDYVKIHKSLAKIISPNNIIQAIADNKYDDYIAKVPIGYQENVRIIADRVYNYLNRMTRNINIYYELIMQDMENAGANSKKEFVARIQKLSPTYRGYLISKYLNKEYNFLKNGGGGYKKMTELKIPKEREYRKC